MCLWSRVPKRSSQKEVNCAGESCGSGLCGCGSAAGQCLLLTASRNTEPLLTPSRALALRGRAEHLHLPTALPGATAALAGVPPPLPLPRH